RILGSVFVTFALMMHMLFLSEVVRSTSVTKAVQTSTDEFPILRDAYWLVIAITILIVYFIYTPERTARLVKEYEVRFSEDLLGNILKIFFYLIVPTVVGLWLAMSRDRPFY